MSLISPKRISGVISMLANIKLGFKDIWEHKLFFITCIGFLFVFNIVISMVIHTIYIDHLEKEIVQPETTETFELIYTDYGLEYSTEQVYKMADIYDNNAVTTRRSQSLSEQYKTGVYLVFGDGRLINPNMASEQDISIYAYDNNSFQSIELLGEPYTINYIPYNDSSKYEKEHIFILYNNDALLETIYNLSEYDPYVFYDLITNTEISIDDTDRIKYFNDFINNELKGVGLKGNFYEMNTNQENEFLKYYLIPLSIILLLIGVLSFMVINKGMLQKMSRDLTIHILHGTLFRHVLLRLYIYYGFIIAISFTLLHKGWISEHIKSAVYGSYIIISIWISLYLAIVLKRKNLFNNLRGDIV